MYAVTAVLLDAEGVTVTLCLLHLLGRDVGLILDGNIDITSQPLHHIATAAGYAPLVPGLDPIGIVCPVNKRS